MRRGDLDSSDLPDDLPDELSQALLDAWRGMSAPSAGDHPDPGHRRPPDRPSDAGGHRRGARHHRTPGPSARPSTPGSSCSDGDGAWFRHPLLAGVLAETYLPGEAAPVHAAWAAHLETVSTEGVDELRRLGDLASHHETGRRGLGGVRRPPPGRRPRREARCAARGRRAAGPGGRLVGGGCRHHRLRRPGAAARASRRAPANGSAACADSYRLLGAARDLVSPERDPLWASGPHASGGDVAFDLGETKESSLTEMRASRGALPGRARQPRARRGLGRLPRSLTGRRGPTRHVGWSRRPWRLPIARGPRPPSAGPTASAPQFWWTPISAQADLDSTVCWEQAHGLGRSDVIGDAYVIRRLLS